MRTDKELLVASKKFASEQRWISWWHLWSTIGVMAILLVVAASELPLPLRILASVIAGLVAVRLFIIYHDYQHGAILQKSWLGAAMMNTLGVIMLNPASVWNRSHDHHHKNNSKTFGSNVGSYPIMTTEAYARASFGEKLAYAAARHPLMMLFGYFTVFLWKMCLNPFLRAPRRHFDGALSLLLQLGMLAYLAAFHGWIDMLLVVLVPLVIASALGAYLFYAQHNFPAAVLKSRDEWSHVDAALHSSSFMKMGPVMNWFTGNIGYHHVHHLNARIPFYRLPEAMRELQELQSPGTTTLAWKDVAGCLRLKLWSPDLNRFVGFNGQ